MARFFRNTFYAIITMVALTACEEGSDAGELYGQWRLVGGENVYVSFSGSLVIMRKTSVAEVYGNFQHVGDSLFMQYYTYKEEPLDTLTIEEELHFRPMNNVRTRITELSGKHLTLTRGGEIWNFEKY